MTDSATRKPLRLWPGVAIVALQLIALYVPGYFAPATPVMVFGMMGSFTVGTLLLFIWWLFFSRARWSDRLGGLALLIVVHVAAFLLADTSAKMVTVVPGIPWLCAVFTIRTRSPFKQVVYQRVRLPGKATSVPLNKLRDLRGVVRLDMDGRQR